VARVKGRYDSKLLGSEEIAEATRALHFEKPEGFTFTPGESIDLFLPEDFPGASDDRQRSFSRYARTPARPSRSKRQLESSGWP
jgi:hypothetical protein